MAKENSVEKTNRVLRQAHSDAIGFEKSTEGEQQFRSMQNGENVERFNFRVRGLIENQILKLQMLLSELPKEDKKK